MRQLTPSAGISELEMMVGGPSGESGISRVRGEYRQNGLQQRDSLNYVLASPRHPKLDLFTHNSISFGDRSSCGVAL